MTKTKLFYPLTFLSGLLLGWLALGWWLWPVAYVGEASTYELNQADKLRYADAVVTSYAAVGIADPAWFAQWTPEEVNQVMEQVIQRNPGKANWARALAGQVGAVQVKPVVKVQNQASEVDLSRLSWLSVGLLALTVAGGGLWLIRRNRAVRAEPEPVRGFETAFISRKTEKYIPVKANPTRTLAHARMEFGPDLPTDQYLPIQRDGEKVGEFGISQVAGLQAWDVWLHDQQAIVTVTKVLADQLSDELASRGEVIRWDTPFYIETPTLLMKGKPQILGSGLVVELAVEGKDAE